MDKSMLIGLLEQVDKELNRRIDLVAVGGTAMTLLDLKPSTIDIDFDLTSEDSGELEKALNAIPHGFRIDIFMDGLIFSQQLPDGHLERSIPIKTGLRKIRLHALHPLDIVASKIGRLNERDLQDIEACIREFKLTKGEIEKRAKQVEYIGREENYIINMNCVLKRFF